MAKQKMCCICKTEPRNGRLGSKICDSYKCAIAIVNINKDKDAKKREKALKQAHTKRKRDFKANDLKLQLKLTQTVFNKLRKLQEFEWFKSRGLEPECISCGKTNMDWCCGHFKTVGSQGALRYDEKNTFLQCNRYCNSGLSGNIEGNKNTRGYKAGLVDRFGQVEADKIFDYCEIDRVKKWTCEELIVMRKRFSKEIKALQAKA